MLGTRIIRRILVILCGVCVLFLGGVLAERWASVAASPLPKPLEQFTTDQKVMALTINVDWGEEYIPGMLDALAKGNAHATFFVTGRWAKNHPELVKKIVESGHQVENHGYAHPHPDRLSVAANREEIKKTESIISGLTGHKTRFYAPPYGEKGASGLKAAADLGYTTVLWTLDTVDWRPESTPQQIAQRILNPAVRFGIKPNKRGAIILMHPKENTVKALPIILAQLNREGYRLLTLNELITLDQAGNTTS